MALGFFFFGIVLLIAGWRGTYPDIGERIGQDFSGFLPWLAAVIAIGAIGYVPELKDVSNGLLLLVIVVMLFSNKGVFATWAQIATQPPAPANPVPVVPQQDQAALSQNPTVNIQLGGSGTPGSAANGGVGTTIQNLTGGFFGGLF